jgi:hypothetical protein
MYYLMRVLLFSVKTICSRVHNRLRTQVAKRPYPQLPAL